MTSDEDRARMNIVHDLSGYQPDIIGNPKNPNQLIIRCEMVDHSGGSSKRTGKYIHLGMTVADSMRLLALLSAAQQQLGLPAPSADVKYTVVPPAKDRN
jgi:hypothetical protein